MKTNFYQRLSRSNEIPKHQLPESLLNSCSQIKPNTASSKHRRVKSDITSNLTDQNTKVPICKTDYLNNTIWCREIFIIQDGITEKSQLSQGFKYKFNNFGYLRRESQTQELSLLFRACSKHWNTRKKFISIFTVEGRMLKSMAELDSSCSVLVVGTSYNFIGFGGLCTSEKEILEAVGWNFIKKDSEIFITCPRKKGILLQDNYDKKAKNILLKFRAKSQIGTQVVEKKREVSSNFDRYKYFNSVKEKLGETSVKLDKCIPKMQHSYMKKLIDKYELSESDIHKIYAQYKTLLIMSVAQNPNHDFRSGIKNSTLIECLRKGESKAPGMIEKLISIIDIDGKGYLCWEEFLKAMSVIYFGSLPQQIDMLFKMYDADLSGTLSFDEICELCKRQLESGKDDKIAEYLSDSFAKVIFSLANVPITESLAAEELKKILSDKEQHSIIRMFCNFKN